LVEVGCFLTRHSAKKESPEITGELFSAHALFASLQLLSRFVHLQTGNLAPSTIHTRKAPVPRFSPECHLLLHAPRRCSAPRLQPYHAKKNKREVTSDHDIDMAYQDEKDEKLDVDKQGGATEISASDAALTRRILLKLDIRYFPAYLLLPSSVYAISSYKALIIWLHQDLARLNSPLPLFLPGSYESRECQNIQSRSKSEYD
jgi:hypothetical protein